jgi:hypothetical protein
MSQQHNILWKRRKLNEVVVPPLKQCSNVVWGAMSKSGHIVVGVEKRDGNDDGFT